MTRHLIAMVALLLAACGNSGSMEEPPPPPPPPPPVTAGSCMMSVAGEQACIDYKGAVYSAGNPASVCAGFQGTYSSASCPSSNVAGTCAVPSIAGQPNSEVDYVYYAPATADSLEAQCQQLGGTLTLNGALLSCIDSSGQPVANHWMESRTRYSWDSTNGCQPEQQSRSCQDGQWTGWSGTYQGRSCDDGVCSGMPVPCSGIMNSVSCGGCGFPEVREIIVITHG